MNIAGKENYIKIVNEIKDFLKRPSTGTEMDYASCGFTIMTAEDIAEATLGHRTCSWGKDRLDPERPGDWFLSDTKEAADAAAKGFQASWNVLRLMLLPKELFVYWYRVDNKVLMAEPVLDDQIIEPKTRKTSRR